MDFRKLAKKLSTATEIWEGYRGDEPVDPLPVETALEAALEHETIEELEYRIGAAAVTRFRRRHAEDETATPDEIMSWWRTIDNAEDAMDSLTGRMGEYTEGTTGLLADTDWVADRLLVAMLCETDEGGYLAAYEEAIGYYFDELRERLDQSR